MRAVFVLVGGALMMGVRMCMVVHMVVSVIMHMFVCVAGLAAQRRMSVFVGAQR